MMIQRTTSETNRSTELIGLYLRGLSKILGSDSLAEELFTELGTNGLIDAVGRSNDFLDLTNVNVEVNAKVCFQPGLSVVSKIINENW